MKHTKLPITREPNSDDEATTHGPDSDDATDPEKAAKVAEAIDEIGVERLTDEIVGACQELGGEPFDSEVDDTGRDDAVGDDGAEDDAEGDTVGDSAEGDTEGDDAEGDESA